MCVCVCVSVHMHACVCVHAYIHVCAGICNHVHALCHEVRAHLSVSQSIDDGLIWGPDEAGHSTLLHKLVADHFLLTPVQTNMHTMLAKSPSQIG